MTVSTVAVTTTSHTPDEHYNWFLERVKNHYNLNSMSAPVFTTSVSNLYETYLNSFKDPVERQAHACNCCRRFIERFGGLVTIGPDGRTHPVMWGGSTVYADTDEAMAQAVRKAYVTGVFLSSEPEWGVPKTGPWTHFSVVPKTIFKHPTLNAEQVMAEKKQDFQNVSRALDEFKQPLVEKVLALLEAEQLYRSEKVLGPAKWLHDLHVARSQAKGKLLKENVVWLAIATAPSGFCHPRTSMVGTLLVDVANGVPFSTAAKRFADKMQPDQYQRPQAPPKAGNIAAAEKIVEQLQSAGALARRYARLEEIQALWRPTPKSETKNGSGVFGHLKAKDTSVQSVVTGAPAKPITWVKFESTVLHKAGKIELLVPGHGSFAALTTAVNFDAPPILQWDTPEKRNPVAWYQYTSGSPAHQWLLSAGSFRTVSAVTLQPSMWNGGMEHQGAGVLFVLEGAKDTHDAGSCLFPEILKAEYREIRSVMEAHSKSSKMEGTEDQSASGLICQKSGTWNVVLRVWVGNIATDYKLDRWD